MACDTFPFIGDALVGSTLECSLNEWMSSGSWPRSLRKAQNRVSVSLDPHLVSLPPSTRALSAPHWASWSHSPAQLQDRKLPHGSELWKLQEACLWRFCEAAACRTRSPLWWTAAHNLGRQTPLLCFIFCRFWVSLLESLVASMYTAILKILSVKGQFYTSGQISCHAQGSSDTKQTGVT